MEFDASLNPFLRCARDINTLLLNWPLKSAHGALTIFSSREFSNFSLSLSANITGCRITFLPEQALSPFSQMSFLF